MSRRTRVAEGVYQTPTAFEVAVAVPGQRNARFVGGFTTQAEATSYRLACEAANDAQRPHPDRDAFLAVLRGGDAPVSVSPADSAELWCDDAEGIPPCVLRRALREVHDEYLATSRATDHSQHRRWCRLIDEELGLERFADLERPVLDAFMTAMAARWGQSTVDNIARVLTDALGWATDHGHLTHNPVGRRRLKATSTRPRKVNGEHRLVPGSMTSDAVAVLKAHPDTPMSARQVAEIMEAAGSRHAERGVDYLAGVLCGRLRDLVLHLTVPHLHRVARGRYAYEPELDICPVHPDDRVLPSRRKTLVATEILAVARLLPPRLVVMLWLTAILGLRGGEAMGLRIRDFDPVARLIRVRVQTGRNYRTTTGTTRKRKVPKTKSSIRNLPLPATLARWLEAYILAEHGTDAWECEDKRERLIVVLPDRGPVTEANLASWETPLAAALLASGAIWRTNGSAVTGHDLRHTASNVLFQAVPEATRSAWLGHNLPMPSESGGAGADVTMAVYTQIGDEHLAEAAEHLEGFIADQLDKLELGENPLDDWCSTADAARMLGLTIDRANNILASYDIVVHDVDDLRRPRVRRGYRRGAVYAVVDDLDERLGVPVDEYCAERGIDRAELDALAAVGELEVGMRYFRREPGGPVARRLVVTVSGGSVVRPTRD